MTTPRLCRLFLLTAAWIALHLAPSSVLAQTAVPSPSAFDDVARLEREAEQRFAQDDLATAAVLYRQLAGRLTDVPEKVRVMMTVAWLEHLRARPREALEAMTEALALDPQHEFQANLYDSSFADLYYRALQRAIITRDQEAARLIEAALGEMASHRHPEAKALLNDALRLSSDNPSALYNLALVDLRQGHLEAALDGFQKVVSLYSPDATTEISGSAVHHPVDEATRALAMINAGLILNRQKLFSEASSVLEQAVELAPDNAAAWNGLGSAQRRLGNLAGATRSFERGHALDPNNASVTNNLSLTLIDRGLWEEAEALLSKATLRHPDNASIWLNLARSYMALGNSHDAIRALQQTLRNDPDNSARRASPAATLLADLYLRDGQPDRSLEFSGRAISWNPSSAAARTFQGLAHRQLGNLDAAIESLREAIRLDPTSAQSHNNLGSVLLSKGDRESARESFERALAIDPSLQVAIDNLALLQ